MKLGRISSPTLFIFYKVICIFMCILEWDLIFAQNDAGILIGFALNLYIREFPVGLVVRIPGLHYHSLRAISGWRTEIPQAVQHRQKETIDHIWKECASQYWVFWFMNMVYLSIYLGLFEFQQVCCLQYTSLISFVVFKYLSY